MAIPAVIEAGAETKFCASLLQPSETVVMTVTLMSREENTTLLTHTSNEDFHTCTQFKVSSPRWVLIHLVISNIKKKRLQVNTVKYFKHSIQLFIYSYK